MRENPFAVITPEKMTAEKADQLFVELHADFPQIKRPGNTIITGARGCGKTMLIRCAMPDVLMYNGTPLSQLDFLGMHVSVKKTSPNVTELLALDNAHAPYLINEHILSLHVLMHSLLSLTRIPYDDAMYSRVEYENFFNNVYKRYMELSGCTDDISVDYTSATDFFQSLYRHTEKMQSEFILYAARSAPNAIGVDYSYTLPILSFLRFLYPVFKEIPNLPGFPQNKPIYIFIDDADNLSKTQTEILNTWLAYRTQPEISIKVSTQIGLYKTYLSSSGVLVESPHDYQEVNISYRYTTNITKGTNYYDKAIKILEKRLAAADINIAPDVFFPLYIKQEEDIQKERDKIRREYAEKGRGNRIDDDVRRYAIPNYIRDLGGTRKSRRTYRYAGLDNIVHLSSGIIRYLLDAAMKMYDIATRECETSSTDISFIDTRIQDEVLRDQADHFLFTELKKSESFNMDSDDLLEPIRTPTSDAEYLQNLISAMGRSFHDILVSERSERKVFSIALSQRPNRELKRVFELGVRLGFFHEARIGTKDGSGRTMLYILNRCFAPLFTLDPTGFQGYLFMTNQDLMKAINDGKQLRDVSLRDAGDSTDPVQLSLEDIWEV